MNQKKLLYVDDETLALKYFERLVGGIVPVLTADSVKAGIKVLEQHGNEIAILVTDQRMPGAYGNELLQYTREHHPHIIRMLTTAYSEIDDAIAAINSGEIYRYITKPWNVDSLRADLKNALELADLKAERDSLLNAKLSVQQGQWLTTRLGLLAAVLGCCADQGSASLALHRYLLLVMSQGGARLDIPWGKIDLVDWVQADASRHVAIASHVQLWCKTWALVEVSPSALQAAQVLKSEPVQSSLKHVAQLLQAHATEIPTAIECAGLAWFVWSALAMVKPSSDDLAKAEVDNNALSNDWLAADIEHLTQTNHL